MAVKEIGDNFRSDLLFHLQIHIIPEKPLLSGDPAFDDLSPDTANERIERAVEFGNILSEDLNIAARVRIAPDGIEMHNDLDHGDDQRGKDPNMIHSGSDRNSDSGNSPDSRSSGQTLDVAPAFEDHSCTKETDSADDLCSKSCGISAAASVHKIPFIGGKIDESIFRDDHDKRRAAANDHVRSDSGFLKPAAALNSYGKSAYTRHDQSDKEVYILSKRELTVQI